MDNGCEVFAKLPNPNAGATRFTIASEIATRKLLSEVLDVPVPRVLACSFDASNSPVGAEYIIEEKRPAFISALFGVNGLENTLAGVTFDMHGCIYFKDDLRSLGEEPKEANIQSDTTDIPDIFAIGPLTTGELWNGVRSGMDLDRGPWKDPSEYTRALGRNEIAEYPEDGLALLDKYMKVAPHLTPQPTNGVASEGAPSNNVLMHPDLHLDNIFVDPVTLQITRIVDWQSARVAPLFYHADVPRMCAYRGPLPEGWAVPERSEDFGSLSAEEQRKIDDDLESQILHKYYEAQVYRRSPRYWSVLKDMRIPIFRKLVWLVTEAWENRDLFFLRESLMSLFAHWEELVPGVPCPINFTIEDVELHSEEEENINGVGEMLRLFRDESVLPVDGMVDPKDYDIAQKNSRELKDTFIGLAKNDEERELFTRLWPYQEPAET
ncbi:hypothetical protein PENFLA_c002G04504 [Penicillium flavigenum]|uniref:Altered inheritance of mitochondria protein 9, mitochondrial n=1 Tax=Penicillium flavigenum TaxID=254877 RepID=A0A1V6TXJ2_9EURO|nr:hypothetical protein PENFLA_c002G04504 [Penicillium flavigenum]